MAQHHIICPTCKTSINIEEALLKDVEQRLSASFDAKLQEEIEKATKTAAAQERERTEIRLAQLERENAEKTAALKMAKNAEVEVLELQRKLREKDEEVETLIRKRLVQEQAILEEKIRKSANEQFELREREILQKLEAVKKEAEELRRKAEQSSQQLTGEVQELAIEEYLRNSFPTDEIVEIRKGTAGADCLHRIMVNGRTVGTIVYESKRTKSFEPSWIEKFKGDVRSQGAEVGVLVTKALPKDVHGFTLTHGVFICGFQEFKALCFIVREMVLRIGMMGVSQEHRGDKMSMLYDYLTSAEFRHNIEAIVETFVSMKSDLDKEQRAMNRMWKQREKQLERVLLSTSGLYGSIKGIAGADVADLPSMELGETSETDSNRLDLP